VVSTTLSVATGSPLGSTRARRWKALAWLGSLSRASAMPISRSKTCCRICHMLASVVLLLTDSTIIFITIYPLKLWP